MKQINISIKATGFGQTCFWYSSSSTSALSPLRRLQYVNRLWPGHIWAQISLFSANFSEFSSSVFSCLVFFFFLKNNYSSACLFKKTFECNSFNFLNLFKSLRVIYLFPLNIQCTDWTNVLLQVYWLISGTASYYSL